MNDYRDRLENKSAKRYAPYGECIYCGATSDLTDEHIVPFGLGGDHVLPKSSCKPCAAITSRFERTILRGELRQMRIYRELQSRRKHRDAPSSYPVDVVRNGVEETIEVPLKQYPILVPFFEFPPPRLITGEPSRPGIDVFAHTTISFGADPAKFMKDFGIDNVKIKVRTAPAQFARLLAKIGFSMAAATGALKLLSSESPIRNLIKGTDENFGDYIGTLTLPLSTRSGVLHTVAVFPDTDSGQLVADIQLFSDSGTPRYGVLLGALSNHALAS